MKSKKLTALFAVLTLTSASHLQSRLGAGGGFALGAVTGVALTSAATSGNRNSGSSKRAQQAAYEQGQQDARIQQLEQENQRLRNKQNKKKKPSEVQKIEKEIKTFEQDVEEDL